MYREVPVPLQVEVPSELAAGRESEWLRNWVERERRTPFEWSRAPLWRVFIHRIDALKFQVTLSFHHLILDGWSAATLQTELLDHYSTLLRGGTGAPHMPRARFSSYVALDALARSSEESASFWRDLLVNATVLALPPTSDESSAARGERALTRGLRSLLNSQQP